MQHTPKISATLILLLLFISAVVFVPAQKRLLTSPVPETFKSPTESLPAETRITTIKSSYDIGETVFISGSGFGKFESVTFRVDLVDDFQKTVDLAANWTAFADENGNLSGDWKTPSEGKFVITATGESGKQTTTIISSAASVTPVVISGNPNCATLNASTNSRFAHITSDFGFKIDPPSSGTFPYTTGGNRQLTGGAPADAANSLTVDITNNSTFDWSSTRSITAVIVKGGPNANVYPYNPGSIGDKDLKTVSGQDISHIEVCFGPPPASITIIKDTRPNSPQWFKFKAWGQVNDDFALVDNGVVGPDRIKYSNLTKFGAANTVSVMEDSSAPYSLTQINCTSNGSGTENNVVSISSRTVTIRLESGENVVCTFVNSITTAAHVSASGRVTDAFGNPISKALVTIQDSATGQTRTVLTGSFGYYTFEDLPSGSIYVISASHKRYTFSQGAQVFVLNDAVENMNFVADF